MREEHRAVYSLQIWDASLLHSDTPHLRGNSLYTSDPWMPRWLTSLGYFNRSEGWGSQGVRGEGGEAGEEGVRMRIYIPALQCP